MARIQNPKEKFTMIIKPEIELTEYEKKYIDIVGKRFGAHGRSEAMGQVFALLNLKAKTPESAINQQKIAMLIGKSLSTASRTLQKLVKGGYCDYILEDNEQSRAERKYHAKRDYSELVLARISQTLKEARGLIEDLEELAQSVPAEKSGENQLLLEQINLYISQTQVANKAVEKLGEDILKDLERF